MGTERKLDQPEIRKMDYKTVLALANENPADFEKAKILALDAHIVSSYRVINRRGIYSDHPELENLNTLLELWSFAQAKNLVADYNLEHDAVLTYARQNFIEISGFEKVT